jgi:integrase
LLLSRTGLRMGEALAVQWGDVAWTTRTLRVARAYSGGRLGTSKSGAGRDVDLSQQTVDILRRLEVKRKAETLRRGWGDLPAEIFPNEAGRPMDASRVRKQFAKVRRAAKLPGHFTPHCLRHTFASLLLQQGESPAYVQRQLGHASITLTCEVAGGQPHRGRWPGRPGAEW